MHEGKLLEKDRALAEKDRELRDRDKEIQQLKLDLYNADDSNRQMM